LILTTVPVSTYKILEPIYQSRGLSCNSGVHAWRVQEA
jgi:hypothetical protein